MTKDLTKGRPLTLILQFGLPILLGMLFQQLYSVVDTAIVGKFLGGNALAAVGSTGSINFLVVGGSIGICSGFAIPIAQRFGAGDYDALRGLTVKDAKLEAALRGEAFLLFDGGMGTMMQAAGIAGPGVVPDLLNLSAPQQISAILACTDEMENVKRVLSGNNCADLGLTESELAIARLIAQRKTRKEIAETLYLAEHTVKNQLTHIYDKLHISGKPTEKREQLTKMLSNEK